jgi:SAM-dependent methyltransferase
VSSYDDIAKYYDVDMGVNNNNDDVEFYLDYANRCNNEILELACGTGRITLPLLRKGYRVTGIDSSILMLKELSKKMENDHNLLVKDNLTIHHKNMLDFNIDKQFSLILCPFCAFTYLTTETEQVIFLKNIYKHLKLNGIFIVDSFIPKYNILTQPNPVKMFDYERKIDAEKSIRRSKIIEQDLTTQINKITRNYEIFNKEGHLIEKFSMNDEIRYTFKRELELLLQQNNFIIQSVYGDYKYSPFDYSADKMVFVTTKRK